MSADLIAKWCAKNPEAVLWDASTGTLRDVFSAKTLPLDVASVREVVEREDTQSGQSYLIVLREDGAQLALARPGIAFPPQMRNSGDLPGLPQVVCWRDFQAVAEKIDHVLREHPEEGLTREVLDMVRYTIALLDGAREAGFEVGEEERRIQAYLDEVERRVGTRL